MLEFARKKYDAAGIHASWEPGWIDFWQRHLAAWNKLLTGRVAEDVPEEKRAEVGSTTRQIGVLLFERTQANWRAAFDNIPSQAAALVRAFLINVANYCSLNGQLLLLKLVAERAVEVSRRSSSENDLACCLVNLGNVQRELGDRVAARDSYREVLEILRRVAKLHPAAFEQYFASTLNNLGNLYRLVQRPDVAFAVFEAALDEFGDDADIVTIWKDGRPLASLLNFYFGGACHSFWGGGTKEARQWRANDLVYYEAMRRAILRGSARADFGRSKVGSGPWARKRIWGFAETPLVYSVRGAPREVNPLSPKYRLRIAAWQRLPLWLANRLGPAIARGLG